MAKPKVMQEVPVPLSLIKEELVRVKERDGELNFRGVKCEEYLATFVKLSYADTQKLIEELKGLGVPRMGDDIVIKVVDLLPKSVDDLKVILQAYHVTITKENIQKIVDVVSKYA